MNISNSKTHSTNNRIISNGIIVCNNTIDFTELNNVPNVSVENERSFMFVYLRKYANQGTFYRLNMSREYLCTHLNSYV